eukprot:10446808-Lingulodinium_polyedra.AAC.1
MPSGAQTRLNKSSVNKVAHRKCYVADVWNSAVADTKNYCQTEKVGAKFLEEGKAFRADKQMPPRH